MLTVKQNEYVRNATHRWNIKTGATGSGKTYMDIVYTIPYRLRERHGMPGLNIIMGNTRGTLQRNIIDPLRSMFSPSLVSDIRSDNTATLFGEECYCLGADKINQVSKIQGATVKYCYGDEITTWHEDVFTMLKSRLRTPMSCFDGTCNPSAPHHWVKQFLDSDADIYHQSYVIDDNPNLPPDFVENLKREYAGSVYYDRFILGLWVIAEGLVYPSFDKTIHVVHELPRCCTHPHEAVGQYYISIDYGTKNPFSAGLWCICGGIATRIAEYYHDGRKTGTPRTDEEHYAALEALCDRVTAKYNGDRERTTYHIQSIVIDPSAASMIECIRRHGRFLVNAAKNDVMPGIGVTASLLCAGKVKIHASCKSCIEEFATYRWDEKAKGDAVIKENDHAMDDVRYFCYTILRREFRWDQWSV